MSAARAFRLILAVIIAVPVLSPVPAYSWHGSGSVVSLAIDPQTPSTLYAGTWDSGVFKSTDGGATWSATGLTSVYIGALVIVPQTPSTIYAAAGSGGVYKSTDGGGSWHGVNTGLPGASVSQLVLDPQTSGTLYAVIPEFGVFKSTDGGATWNTSLRTDSLFHSIDVYGYQADAVLALAIDPQNSATFYASAHYRTTYIDAPFGDWGDVLKSTDGGVNWNSTALDSAVVVPLAGYPLAIAPQTSQTPTTIYAGDLFYCGPVMFKSTDGGASWVELTVPRFPYCANLVDLTVDPSVPTTLYAVVSSAGVFKSMDGGATWNAVSTGLSDVLQAYGFGLYLYDLAIDPQNPNTLYLGTVAGVFKSTDGGGYWSPSGLFQHSPLASVSLNPPSVIAGSTSTGTVTLATAAPVGGATVTLSSSNPTAATVPASVTVTAGATSANFTVSTSGCGRANISAAFDGATRSAGLSVVPPVTLSSLSLNPTSVSAGSPSTGTVTLSGPAPAGGAVVTLSSGNAAVATVPASVTVAAAATSANFTVSTSSVLPPTYSAITVAILASHCGTISYQYLQVTLPPATTLSSVSLDPTSVPAGSASTGTVTLSAAAPAVGAEVALYSNAAIVMVPAGVTVPAGFTRATFTVSTASCTSGLATISGIYNGISRSGDLRVTLPVADTIVIQLADYFTSKRELRVAAKSTNSTATLRVYVYVVSTGKPGEFIGTLTKGGDGTYRGQFGEIANPQNIILTSSLCGSATSAVRSK